MSDVLHFGLVMFYTLMDYDMSASSFGFLSYNVAEEWVDGWAYKWKIDNLAKFYNGVLDIMLGLPHKLSPVLRNN